MSTLCFRRPGILGTRVFSLLLLMTALSVGSRAQSKSDCSPCAVFPSVTLYHTLQSGPGNGVGFEAGNWKKEKGSFSYFFGSSLVWQSGQTTDGKTNPKAVAKPVSMSMYVKGQVALGNRLYATLTPGFQDLSFFTLKAGFRYVIPLSNRVGIGLEPNYSVFQNVIAFNTNLHIALR